MLRFFFFTFTFRKYHLGFTVENGNLVAKISGWLQSPSAVKSSFYIQRTAIVVIPPYALCTMFYIAPTDSVVQWHKFWCPRCPHNLIIHSDSWMWAYNLNIFPGFDEGDIWIVDIQHVPILWLQLCFGPGVQVEWGWSSLYLHGSCSLKDEGEYKRNLKHIKGVYTGTELRATTVHL